MDVSEIFESLNEPQRKAVTSDSQNLLVLAGAGSGKTRVITERIAHLLNIGIMPENILALTFTNKAAKEMQNRVSSILKKEAISLSWLGTFHSISAKLLRKHAQAVNLNSNFTIIDRDDQLRFCLLYTSPSPRDS